MPPLTAQTTSPDDDATADINPKVLIVDDEVEIVEEIIELLEDEGFDCVGVFSPTDALAMIESDRAIGTVLSDIRMPGMDGLVMARHILETHGASRDISLILMTGHAGMNEAIEALQLGVEDFLTKPVNPDQLIHAVGRARELARLRQRDREFKLRLALEVKAKTRESRLLASELAKRNVDLMSQNAQLNEVALLKSQFMSMISHELNTPINAITGFSQILRNNLKGSDNSSNIEMTRLIIESSERLRDNVDSILLLAAAQSGEIKPSIQPLVACDLIDAAIAPRETQAQDRGVSLIGSSDESDLQMLADPKLTSVAIAAIVDNALAISSRGDTVTISCVAAADTVTITVTDTGPGMTLQAQQSACEPLQNAPTKDSQDSDQGLGLGLPLAFTLCALQNGQLSIDSNPGQGTTALLTFPRTHIS